jgi:hypothetical protein
MVAYSNRPFNSGDRRGLFARLPPATADQPMQMPGWTYGISGERNPALPPVSPHSQMLAELLGQDRRGGPTPRKRIDDVSAVDPTAGRDQAADTGAMPWGLQLGQGGFPGQQPAPAPLGGAPLAAAPPMPRPAPVRAPMNIVPKGAADETGPLTFWERNGYLQRDPDTGEYLNPQLAALAEQLMRGG